MNRYKSEPNNDPGIKNAEALLEQVKNQAESVFAKYEEEVRENGKATEKVRADFKESQEKFAELTKAVEDIKAKATDMQQRMSDFKETSSSPETMGSTFVGSKQYQDYLEEKTEQVKVGCKNTILGESSSNPNGILTQAERMAGIVPMAQRRLNILDIIPVGGTSANAIEYAQQTTDTNNAAETAEGEQKPESDIDFSLVTEFVRTIPTFLRISEQALKDSEYVESFINARLGYFVRKKLQTQILVGNGTAPNLSGLFNTGRHTPFVGTAGEHQLDSISRAKEQVILNDYDPNTVFLNPEDWGEIERLKDTSDSYLGGNGGAIYYPGSGLPPQLWGLNVVVSNDVPAGNGCVLDINAVQLVMREDVDIKFFEQDADNVQKNLVTVRAELRAGLLVYDVPAIVYGDITPTV